MIGPNPRRWLVKIGHSLEGNVWKVEKLSRRHSSHLAKLVIEVSLIKIAARQSGFCQSGMLVSSHAPKGVEESTDAGEFLRTQSTVRWNRRVSCRLLTPRSTASRATFNCPQFVSMSRRPINGVIIMTVVP